MKILRSHRTVLSLALAFLLLAAMFNVSLWKSTAQDLKEPLLPLTPGVLERNVTIYFRDALKSHISQRELDSTLSKEAFRLYIKSLDPKKHYFYQSDIDEFREKYELKLCELLKQNPVDVRPAFEIYNRYLTRFKERVETVQKILEKPIDFTTDEMYVFDKSKDFTLDQKIINEQKLQTFPPTPEEAYERWRKQVKYELLQLKAERIANEKKREKALTEGKEPEEIDDRDPIERLRMRYVSRQRRMLLEGHIENREILEIVRQQANDEVMELFLSAIAGALDPHSNYMSPSTMQSFKTGMQKGFEGIGATLFSEDGYIVVREVIAGSPAQEAGIRPKDKIQGVGQGSDGKIEDVIDFKVADVVKLIRGPGKTVVRLDILPGGKGPSKVVEIVRAKITLDDQAAKSEIFEAGMKPDRFPYKIGFIDLPDFYLDTEALRQRDINARSAAADVKKMLEQFVEKNVDAVVIDLRSNGGGSLDEAIKITKLFTGAGTVVQVKDDIRDRPQPRGTDDPSCEWTGPLVVVTNKFSASASEIFVGAIKDYRRGLIVGDSTSHGKGTVQSLLELGDRFLGGGGDTPFGAGKITIQGYYRPGGLSPQRMGVEADIVLPSLFDVMEGIMESDLDNALSFKPQPAASRFTPKHYVTPEVIAGLKRRSEKRIGESEDFAKELEKIGAYKERSARRAVPLNETKYMAEVQRFNTDEWEQDELEDMMSKDKKIKRDFYVEEVLALTVDYIMTAREYGIAFPKERTVRPSSRRGLFGLGGW